MMKDVKIRVSLVEREGEDRNDICAPPYAICDEEEFRNEDFCKVS